MLNADFASIYDAYYQDVYLYLMKLTKGRKDLAEELTQETFYQVFISLHRFKGKSKLRTWIIEIAKHTCYNYYKKNPIHTSVDEETWMLTEVGTDMSSMEEALIKLEQKENLRKAILGLENKYRKVVISRVYYELTFQQIGSFMNISENSAKVLFYRAKAMIKNVLEE